VIKKNPQATILGIAVSTDSWPFGADAFSKNNFICHVFPAMSVNLALQACFESHLITFIFPVNTNCSV
jgi:hypothetical protein